MKKEVLILVLILAFAIVNAQVQDTDSDGMPDAWENKYTPPLLNETADSAGDPDADKLTNLLEYINGGIPTKQDTDEDGWTDYQEYIYGTNMSNNVIKPTKSLINITLVEPRYASSQVSTFRLNISLTNNSKECRYSLNPAQKFSDIVASKQKFLEANPKMFYISDFTLNAGENQPTAIYVKCNTTTSYINEEFPVSITLSLDSTQPTFISAYSDPTEVIESLSVDLIAKTNDKTACRFDQTAGFSEDPEQYFAYFDTLSVDKFKTQNTLHLDDTTTPTIADGKTYTFYVLCMNPAGLYTKITQINFSVNTATLNRIVSLSPSGYIKDQKVNISVLTNKDASCRYVEESAIQPFPQGFSKIHYFSKDVTMQQLYSYAVSCTFNDGETLSGQIQFMGDNNAPISPDLKAAVDQCDNTTLSATFNSTDSGSGLGTYSYKLTKGTEVITSGETNQSMAVYSGTLIRGETYVWTVNVADKAGNNATFPSTKSTKILLASDLKCKSNNPPILTYNAVFSEKGLKVATRCNDDYGCQSYYLFLITPISGCVCETCKLQANQVQANQSYIYEVETSENATFCYKITDTDGINTTQNFSMQFDGCATGASCCNKKQAKICSGTCNIVTDVKCNTTGIDSDNDLIIDEKEILCGLDLNNQSDASLDFDNDGLTNKAECLGTFGTDIRKNDTDDDGFTDKKEQESGTNPKDKTSFPAPIVDPNLDTDDDDMKDTLEKKCGTDPKVKDAEKDNDEDGLTNKEECDLGTDIEKKDTDDDGVEDAAEVKAETDPLDPDSKPKNHVLSIVFFFLGFGVIGGGIFLFVKNQQPSTNQQIPGKHKEEPKPFVDFKYTKKELEQKDVQYHQLRREEPENELDLDDEIRKKREFLRVRKMTSVFDEFQGQKQNESSEPKTKKQEQEKKGDVFDKLDRIENEDAFDELEKLGKGGKH